MATFRESSKLDWQSSGSLEHINAGALQRIADAAERQAVAAEKMAASYDQLRADRDWWKSRAKSLEDETSCLAFSIRSLRGVITKLKNAARSSQESER